MIQHHPTPEILAEYAGGALHSGAMLVVACHVTGCAVCAAEVALWEGLGGTLLDDIEPAGLSRDALDRALAQLDEVAPKPAANLLPKYLERFDVPAPLRHRRIGRRQWVTPGIWFAPVAAPHAQARTYLVYASARTILAEHTHAGREFTQVLKGAFADDSGAYGKGDFACTDDDITHAPGVTADSECLCLISADAPMRLKSLPARFIQSMTGKLY